MFQNETMTMEEFQQRLGHLTWGPIIMRDGSKFSGNVSVINYGGKEVKFRDSKTVVLFEKCEYCGSKSGTKRNLLGYECCISCGGPV